MLNSEYKQKQRFYGFLFILVVVIIDFLAAVFFTVQKCGNDSSSCLQIFQEIGGNTKLRILLLSILAWGLISKFILKLTIQDYKRGIKNTFPVVLIVTILAAFLYLGLKIFTN